jgi:hypothetical protein
MALLWLGKARAMQSLPALLPVDLPFFFFSFVIAVEIPILSICLWGMNGIN